MLGRPAYELGVAEAAGLIRRGKLTSLALVESCLQLISSHEPKVCAFAHMDAESARKAAIVADAVPLEKRGLLHGVPFGVKDIMDVNGWPTGFGLQQSVRDDRPAAATSSAIQHCLNAGAILIGKTVTTELAYYTQNGTRNPHSLVHSPGGSSSGSAAAVAARFLPAAIGSQTAGSLIRPGSFCGVVVWKATLGAVALDRILQLSTHLDSPGVFCRRPADALLFHAVLTGGDTDETGTPHNLLQGGQAEKSTGLTLAARLANDPPLRLGLVKGPEWAHASPEAAAALAAAAEALSRSGAVVADVPVLPSLFGLCELQQELQEYETSRARAFEYSQLREHLSSQWVEHCEQGMRLGPEAVHAALAARDAAYSELTPLLEDYDALLTISHGGVAPLYEQGTGDPRFNRAWTLLGMPCVGMAAPPAAAGGTVDSGALPVGVQLVGKRFDDARLLRVAERVFEAMGAHCPRPPLLDIA